MNRTDLLAALAICTAIFAIMLIAVLNLPESKSSPEVKEEVKVAEAPTKTEFRQKGRTEKDEWWPTWDADPLVYVIVDDEDMAGDMWVYEWTPYGNRNTRCVTTPKGGVDCFQGESSPKYYLDLKE